MFSFYIATTWRRILLAHALLRPELVKSGRSLRRDQKLSNSLNPASPGSGSRVARSVALCAGEHIARLGIALGVSCQTYVPGHEIAAWSTETGPGVNAWKKGDSGVGVG